MRVFRIIQKHQYHVNLMLDLSLKIQELTIILHIFYMRFKVQGYHRLKIISIYAINSYHQIALMKNLIFNLFILKNLWLVFELYN